jgi:hypothetical protein
MKKNLLSILSAITIFSSVAVAQPTLTAAGMNQVVGDVYTLANGTSVNPGSAGANQTWTVIPTTMNTSATYSTSLPSATPYASSFTAANVSYFTSGYYFYNNTSASAMQNNGQYLGLTLSYSNPEDILHFPFNMGNTYSDTWAVTFINGTTFTRTGTTTVTYDGYGSLKLASGVYNNAVRVHFQQVYSDVYSGGTINYNNDEYMWYINGNHQPVAVTYTLTNSTSPSNPTKYAVIMSNVVSSVYDHEDVFSSISTFPVPASNEINFNLNNTPVTSIEIIDIAGKSIYNQPVIEDHIQNYVTVNTSEFKDGIYFAKFTTKDGQIGTKKISIAK